MARTLIASDDFNRANEDPLSGGGNWAALSAPSGTRILLTSNSVKSSHAFGAEKASRWVGAGTFSDDQYASIVIGAFAGNGLEYTIGVICRASADTEANRDYYYFYAADSTGTATFLGKVVNGTNTVLGSGSPAWTNGDRIELEVVGSTLTACKNGTPLGGAFTVTGETSLTTGKPGICCDGDAIVTGDDWQGGNATAAAAGGILNPAHFTGKFQDFTGGIS